MKTISSNEMSSFIHRAWMIVGLLILVTSTSSNRQARDFPDIFDHDPYTFEAGVYIITQKALDEAPYRYANFLQKILRRMEKQRMPQKQDKDNCDIHYKVTPAAENSHLNLVQDSLEILLNHKHETISISAELTVSIPARVWIWNYLNFLNLWCMYLWTICGGDVVYYNARLRIHTEFQVNWHKGSREVQIRVLPIQLETKEGPDVTGCKPPWFVKLFSSWQKILNNNVQTTIEIMAQDFQKTLNIPQTFSPVKNAFVKYTISDFKWHEGYIVIQAEGTFTATIDAQNITFKPQASAKRIGIPSDSWSFQSENDPNSHLLQGTRISSTLLTSLMWFADASKETDYHGNTTILDSWINTTIFYKPPIVGIPHDMFLNVSILEGIIKADCTPQTQANTWHIPERKTLFEAAFFNLTGNGTVQYKVSNDSKPGIILQVEDFDLSTLVTKPFKPRIPLPENLQSEIMKALISEMRPVMNAYLETKAIILPKNLAPFLAHPEIQLFHTKSQEETSHGYVSLMSYCTCPQVMNNKKHTLTLCSKKSKVCRENHFFEDMSSEAEKPTTVYPEAPIVQEDFGDNLEVTYFQSSNKCNISQQGQISFKYLLPFTNGICSSIADDKQSFYSFDGLRLQFKCFDAFCLRCEFDISDIFVTTCHAFLNSSIHIGEVCSQENNLLGGKSEDTFILEQYLNENCNVSNDQQTPHLLVLHTSLGRAEGKCIEASDTMFYKIEEASEGKYDIRYGCQSQDCKKCNWHGDNVNPNLCSELPRQLSIKLSSLKKIKKCDNHYSLPQNAHIIGISCASVIFIFIVIVGLIFRYRNTFKICLQFQKSKFLSYCENSKQAFLILTEAVKHKIKKILLNLKLNLGFRIYKNRPCKSWLLQKGGLDEILQCILLILCGIVGIHFSLLWKSKDNPLSLFNNKTFDQLGLPTEYFDYSPMEKFFNSAREWSFHGLFSSLCFFYVIIWNLTLCGSSKVWKIIWLTAPIFCIVGALMAVILPSVFKSFSGLVHLRRSNETFITKNSKAYDFTNSMVQNAVSGLAQSAVSYIWIMVLQGLGGGLYCGSLLYQLIFTFGEKKSELRSVLRILHNFIAVASLIQPFICLHPVIIWSQTKDSDTHIHFLPLNIAIWLLIMLTKSLCVFLCDLFKTYSPFKHKHIDYGCLIMESVIFLGIYGFLMTLFVQYSDNFNRFAVIAIISIFVWGFTLTFILLSIMSEHNHCDVSTPKMESNEDNQFRIIILITKCKDTIVGFVKTKLFFAYQLFVFIFERKEYNMPNIYGWRIAGRRFFLIVGSSCFTYEVANLYIETSNFNAKKEIESLLHQTGYHLSWPDNDTIFSGSFKKLNNAKRNQAWTLLSSVCFFWFALIMDIFPVLWYKNSLSSRLYMTRWLTASRIFCCTGGILIFSSVIVLASPDYLGASSLQDICPDCGIRFNKAVFRLAEFIIGLFFAGIFTAQLLPILITISPALVRASVLMLLHPSLHEEQDCAENTQVNKENFLLQSLSPKAKSTPSKVALLDQSTNTEELGVNTMSENSKDRMRIVLEEMFRTEALQAKENSVSQNLESKDEPRDISSHLNKPPVKRPGKVQRPKPPVPPRRKKNKQFNNDKGRLLSPANSPNKLSDSNLQNTTEKNISGENIDLQTALSQEVIVVSKNDQQMTGVNPVSLRPDDKQIPQKPSKSGFYVKPETLFLTKLRVSILRNLIFWSSVVAIPITFLSMSVVFQFQNDLTTKLLILAFWLVPILIISVGLFFTRIKVKNMSILWYYYSLYTISFFGLFISLVIHVLVSHGKIDLLTEYIKKSSFWCEMLSEVFLCNVVISDLIYSSLF